MKNLFLLTICLTISFLTQSLSAQTMAVTKDGDTVYLYDNGTWSCSDEEEESDNAFENIFDEDIHFDTITKPFFKPKIATKKVSSKLEFFDFYFNEKTWKQILAKTINSEVEFAFRHKENDIFFAIIPKESELGRTFLFKTAITNVEQGSGNPVKVIKKEVKTINGKTFVHAVFEANFNGFEATFMGNYYSDENGSVQFICWTGTNIFEKYQDQMEDMINGAVIK
jgi:hypothetical protein